MNLVLRLSRQFAFAVAVSALLLVGCGKSELGVYASEKKPMNTTELRNDGTFLITEGGRSLTGKYRIDGKKLLLELPTGQTLIGSIEGKVIVDDQAEKYIKK